MFLHIKQMVQRPGERVQRAGSVQKAFFVLRGAAACMALEKAVESRKAPESKGVGDFSGRFGPQHLPGPFHQLSGDHIPNADSEFISTEPVQFLRSEAEMPGIEGRLMVEPIVCIDELQQFTQFSCHPSALNSGRDD